MRRRPSSLIALFSAALMFGTFLGVATSLAHEPQQPARASQQEQDLDAVKDPASDKDAGKGGAGTHCKLTKECKENYVCQKVGDHKECTPVALKVPKAPVVT